MAQVYDLVIANGTIVNHSGIFEGHIGIKEGKFFAVGNADPSKADKVFDATGLHILPGVIDSQVHFREPGLEHKEDLETGTRAAALGGVTCVFEMPNTKPSTSNADLIAEKLTRAYGRAWVDHAFYVGATAENWPELPSLERLPGVVGVKVFMGASTGDLLIPTDELLDRVLGGGMRRVAIHSEDEARMVERRPIAENAAVPHAHPEWRDAESARLATERLLRLARKHGRRVHVLHVTTADEIPMLAKAKDIATCEVTPQHLTLFAPDCYDRLGTLAQMNPPIRSGEHLDALWKAVRAGVFDVMGSDHAPHTWEEKQKPYPQSPSGMPGVQTMLPLMLDHLAQGNLSLLQLVDLLCHGPQRVFGIANKGRLATGYDADLTIVDLKARREITKSWLASKCGWSPFEGMHVTGWPKATVIRGRFVMREDELIAPAYGRAVKFQECLGRQA